MFRRGIDKEVCRFFADCLLEGSCILTRLRNLLESKLSDNTKAKRYDNYLPVRELDLKDPHATNHNQPIAAGLENVPAVVSHPSTVGTGPHDVATTHEVGAHAAVYNADSHGFHQVPENVQPVQPIVKVIRGAEKKISAVESIPGPVEAAVNLIVPANTAIAQLDTIDATYLQPLHAFNEVVTGIANVCLSN